MVWNGCFFDCNDLDSKLVKCWIASNVTLEPEEKLKHEKLDSKQWGSSFSTKKKSENFVVIHRSLKGFSSSKNFLKAVSFSYLIKDIC